MVTVSPVTPPDVVIPPFCVYTTFSQGGAFIGSDRNSPFGSPQQGTWAGTGGGKFAFTFIQNLFNVWARSKSGQRSPSPGRMSLSVQPRTSSATPMKTLRAGHEPGTGRPSRSLPVAVQQLSNTSIAANG